MSLAVTIIAITAGLVLLACLLLVGCFFLLLWLVDEIAPSRGTTTHYISVGRDLPEKRPFVRTGDVDLPYSIRLQGNVYRWHAREHVHEGDAFFKTFEDGPWKWAAQGRFAGKNLNCGHYFGLSVEAATEEAKYYGIDEQKAVLLELEGASTRILDLTHPDVMRAIFEMHIDNHEIVSWSYFNMLQELVERGQGGNVTTDYIGYRAKEEGYDGILFFSARVMNVPWIKSINRDLEEPVLQTTFDKLRWDLTLLNVVLFSGANVVKCVHTYRIGEGEPLQNPYFGKGLDSIYKVSEYGLDYQIECGRFTLHKPRYFERE
jgi:hypothetical protein